MNLYVNGDFLIFYDKNLAKKLVRYIDVNLYMHLHKVVLDRFRSYFRSSVEHNFK
jgi:hypothetical protein